MIWSGSVATIPTGFTLCDGTNGTPDLRSRFVYGAGNGNTKTSWANGWNNVNGHWPVGQVGGEEQHILTIAEIPSHNHSPLYLTGSNNDNGDPGSYFNSSAIDPNGVHQAANSYTGYTGGDQAHNVLPRFMTLAYIMKL